MDTLCAGEQRTRLAPGLDWEEALQAAPPTAACVVVVQDVDTAPPHLKVPLRAAEQWQPAGESRRYLYAACQHANRPLLLVQAATPRAAADGVAHALASAWPSAKDEVRVCLTRDNRCAPARVLVKLARALWMPAELYGKPRCAASVVVCHAGASPDPRQDDRLLRLLQAQLCCARWVQLPGNMLTPLVFASDVQRLASSRDRCTATVLGPAELAKQGFRTLLHAGRGSEHPPCLVRLDYRPAHHPPEAPPQVALVGKGVTFDSGGISIKPARRMHEMKADMAGAAACVAAVLAAADLGLPVAVTAIAAMIDNAPGGRAMRPGDVVHSRAGPTIEILNTDAEGRLILADALDYACKQVAPSRALVDLATLTGGIVASLGPDYAGLFTLSDNLSGGLAAAGLRAREPVWRMPFGIRRMAASVRSASADVRNVCDTEPADAIYAAHFLYQFVTGPLRPLWAHIDMAGTALTSDTDRATGWGVELLIEWLEKLDAEPSPARPTARPRPAF